MTFDNHLHPRALLALVERKLAARQVVVLTGSRQTGKTTLVRDLLHPPKTEKVYISLDDPDERLRLAADPVRRIDYPGKLVILDEIQKLPILLDAVKYLVDSRKSARFLLLGSSYILLLNQIRETLAGRSALLELWPLSLIERQESADLPVSGLDALWRGDAEPLRRLSERPPTAETARLWATRVEAHLRWGGYPELDRLAAEEKSSWLRDYRKTYLERDLADLGRVSDLDQFSLAQKLFAGRTAQLISYSEVAGELGVSVNTIKRYLRFLEISYQTYILRPLLPTMTGRLIKSPKLYWTDVGLARMLAERPDLNDGAMFETAVLNELLRWQAVQAEPPALHFYRTSTGREIDFVLHTPERIFAIEAKAGRLAHPSQARTLKEFLQTTSIRAANQDAARLGLVVTRGRETRQLDDTVWEIPFEHLFGPYPLQ